MPRLTPARLQFRDDSTPWSEAYGDVYHSSSGGLDQARSVFLTGNGLPQRWQDRERFCIVETGFGLGLNFLATWATWRDDPQRCARLHFVSAELHPFSRDDLAAAHAARPEFEPLVAELLAQWPPLVPGFHRLHLDGGRVTLTLLFGDARELLPQLDARADAFYLDGFSPALNPELWDETLLAELARLAAPKATLATWSVRGATRRALQAAGFDCDKRPGFAAKREMLVGRFIRGAPLPAPQRHALVIGAGLAGSAIANRLLERGWRVELIDAADGPAQGASGNHAGVLRALPSRDDNRLSRLTRAGALYGVRHLERLSQAGLPVRWAACGVLHLARDAKQQARQREVVAALDDPPEVLRFVGRDEAAQLAGWPVDIGGWWFAGGAWVNPPSLCAANLLARPDPLTTHYGRSVATLEDTGTEWITRDADGGEIARAPVAILASGADIVRIAQASALPVVAARGQVSHLRAEPGAPEVMVCRGGYVSPAIDGLRSVGATFSVDDDEPDLREADHAENLDKLAAMLPGFAAEVVGGRVGFRPASPDRLPIVGAVPDASQPHDGTLAGVPRYRDLHAMSGFGARGLVWAALVAEALASRLDGDPLPLERDLDDAMDPARYVLRPPGKARKGED
ncbi:MAG: bifunctional tRNA (5-methylaminomethyl-2-thiouridine)(34)-methyltransferase MnmD/FAD-dependent 5-carboxymethylaminomethyl-2-thiouridine(34) oxidoreductase MnmC [Pseudazoarcus pumilus]|nr:bifunctional tRNA (5-methylaminomethyl-2-thiouridine)(34)-methyltransferase MnmD/FAD-dependent 5-carboxymethylaminomethyl-2-thiouridine(34) oxidoreductase MnmC [Pseudazoarcus pumilus]